MVAEMREVLDELESMGAKPLSQLSVAEARTQASPADAANAVELRRGIPRSNDAEIRAEDIFISSDRGALSVRVYRPPGNRLRYPGILFFHSGGFVIGDVATYDQTARRLALGANALVFAVNYQKAPEHPFPAAHDDAWAAYGWTLDNIETFSGDRNRIAVVGESAGGNLAANVAIRAIAEGLGPPPVAQVLVCPLADSDMESQSYRENAGSRPLGRAAMEWFFNYTFSDAAARNDPRIKLAERSDLGDLPFTTIITADLDPLRSEGQLFADRLRDARVTVDARNVAGVGHEFFCMNKLVPEAGFAMDTVIANLKHAFGGKAKD